MTEITGVNESKTHCDNKIPDTTFTIAQIFSVGAAIVETLLMIRNDLEMPYGIGIRKTERDIFNIKLFNTFYGIEQYKTLFYISSITIIISHCLYHFAPWIICIEFSIIAWCIALMNPKYKWLYKKCCGCCIGWCFSNELRRNVNFKALYNDTKLIAQENNTSVMMKESNENDMKNENAYDYTPIETIILTLKYFESLTHQKSLVEYCHERTSLLDEYIDFISNYNNQNHFQNIIKKYNLLQCDMKCAYSLRHNRDRNHSTNEEIREEKESKYEEKIDEMDHDFTFYTDLLDSTHCVLYHSYDTLWFRYTTTNNKFNINIKVDTFMDGLFKELNKSTQNRMGLWNFFAEELYDSDAIREDTQNNKIRDSNIGTEFNDAKLFNAIQECVYNDELFRNTFNIGLRFYYWSYYNRKEDDDEEQQQHDWYRNDHNCYKKHELYIEAKYDNIKDEILHNNIFTLSIDQYNTAQKKNI